MNLKTAALIGTLIYLLLLTVRAYAVLSPNAFSTNPRDLNIAQTPPDAQILTPEKMRRAPDNTFLTFPEWFLVFSPDEMARFMETRPSSAFPYWGHIMQFWQGYRAMFDVVRDRYPLNADYHTMIAVIGASTTIEYGMVGIYENAVGALTSSLGGLTAEDRFYAESERRYVDFLKVAPWYRFDYLGELKTMWMTTGVIGTNPIRKWERKYFLTTMYLAKAIYGFALGKASESAYGVESEVTSVVVDRVPERMPEKSEVVERYPDGSARMLLPRYAAFADAARALAAQGVNFREIAGNQGAIMLSYLAPASDKSVFAGYPVVLTQPILTQRPLERFALAVPSPELAATLRTVKARLEHVYDF